MLRGTGPCRHGNPHALYWNERGAGNEAGRSGRQCRRQGGERVRRHVQGVLREGKGIWHANHVRRGGRRAWRLRGSEPRGSRRTRYPGHDPVRPVHAGQPARPPRSAGPPGTCWALFKIVDLPKSDPTGMCQITEIEQSLHVHGIGGRIHADPGDGVSHAQWPEAAATHECTWRAWY